jgi:molecular chaperone GrpE
MAKDKKSTNEPQEKDSHLNEDAVNSEQSNNEKSKNFEKIIEELNNQVLYAKAETENIRKRSYEEADKTRKYAVESFSQEVLTVKDSLEASLSQDNIDFNILKDGVELTLKQLNAVFTKFNINEIDPINEKFDPNEHQAISMIDSKDQEPNTVLDVLQKGYKLNDRVIRPAMVVVSKK